MPLGDGAPAGFDDGFVGDLFWACQPALIEFHERRAAR
jgi:hypothetical protein